MDRSAINITIENLKRNGFKAQCFEDRKAAIEAILSAIGPEESVGFGGSMTLEELGLYDALKERGNPVFWHWRTAPGEDKKAILKAAAAADVFLSSTNAVTESGSLVNIDGTANRISGMLYGHKRVFLIAGVNKIARTHEEALIRIKNVACPANARRLNRDTPCAQTGRCMNCTSPDRICMATLIIDRQPGGNPITVYLINESLGY